MFRKAPRHFGQLVEWFLGVLSIQNLVLKQAKGGKFYFAEVFINRLTSKRKFFHFPRAFSLFLFGGASFVRILSSVRLLDEKDLREG